MVKYLVFLTSLLPLLLPWFVYWFSNAYSQQRQQGEVPNEHEDTFILKSNDNQSRVVIRVLSHNPAQLTDEVI